MYSGGGTRGRGERRERYDLSDAQDVGQRGEPPKHARNVGNVQTANVAVPEPPVIGQVRDKKTGKLLSTIHKNDKPSRILATVNRRVDILEYELSHGRISEVAYGEGRLIQAIFERTGLSGGSTWNAGSRVDAVVAKELAVIRKVSDAKIIAAMVDENADLLGAIDAAIVRQVLGENRSFAQVSQTLDLKSAALRDPDATAWVPFGKGGKRAPSSAEAARRRIAYIAARFRDALESLAQRRRR